ncbi:class I adenylate-forming enzyme family protein [Mycolicibacterium sp. 050158]|uniref:class I adenylate-forming enzyme family protein n=1 Tax=Mycolicibacterium sp. 050158 TaxID=3090602 RepID=UPI00299DA823|nr:AMP-binding protein [Mycolicibacterium sp. 050158]MDX1888912.1 AMP-binding protein [Mycolicibacterium sp. 050158]
MTAAISDGPVLRHAHLPADDSVELIDLTVGQLLAWRARTHADQPAFVGVRHDGSPARLTYAQLYDEAARVATALTAVTERGDHVALWAPNVLEWPIIQYGAALAGVVLVALNPSLRAEELQYALTHSRATVLIHADTNREDDLGEVVASIAPGLPGLVCISLSEGWRWRAAEISAAALSVAPTNADDVVMLQYTSGTTGRPKGVVLRHRSLVNVAKLTLEAVGVEHGSVCLNPLPMFHTAGCVIATLGPLWIGGTVVLVERFRPVPVLDALRREQVSVLFYVPAILGALLECQRSEETSAPRLTVIMGGAANVPATMIETAEEVFGASVINLFGQTELAPVLSATRPSDSRRDQLTTVGRPLARVECKIVDPASGETIALGQPGEICARGYQQFVEYLHDPDATASTVDADGFVHTGDLGILDERGYLTVTGRLKDLIIRGGENIAPGEIETVLVGHDAIDDAVVVGLPDGRWGEVVAAVIRPRVEASRLTKTDIVDHVARRLAPYKMPARWFVVDSFPVTPTGKVRKFVLRDAIESGHLQEM